MTCKLAIGFILILLLAIPIFGQVQIKDMSFEKNTKQLQDSDSKIRLCAVQAIAKSGDAKAVDPLTQALNDNDGLVKTETAWDLGKIGDARAINPLIEVLRSNDSNVREWAVLALTKIGKPSVDPLVKSLKDNDSLVRWEASTALGAINDAKAVDPLTVAVTYWCVDAASG
jgi:HEAT repeat protein